MTQIIDDDYKKWILEIKSKIRSAQMKAALSVNVALIEFYWDLGKMIAEKQTAWGSKFLEKVSNDLKNEFPDMKGFSVTNLKYCRLFYNQFKISPQVGDESLLELIKQIPWGHTKLIVNKIKDNSVAKFYIQKTIENGWGRETLALQIKSNLFERQGKAITNFKVTLPEPMSDLAKQTLKDPYNFDFVAMSDSMDLEKQLVTKSSR
jgi:predicted nuclease of restriction endonuclease-like (RecB) superfamily